MVFEGLRDKPQKLSQKNTVALAGELYGDFATVFEDNPGSPDRWLEVLYADIAANAGQYGRARLFIGSEDERREMAQLRKQDVALRDGLWVVTITPDAGSVKGGKYREFPLHPQLVEMGFPDFVAGRGPGYLFLRPSGDGDVAGPRQGLTNRLSEFVREVVDDMRVKPNHGWRHRFKTVAIDAGAGERVIDAIVGHAPRNVGDTYGEVTLKAMADAINKLPRYEVGSEDSLTG